MGLPYDTVTDRLRARLSELFVHRKLKPDNILIRRDGFAQILDLSTGASFQQTAGLCLRLAIVCARKRRLLPVGVHGQRSHDRVGHDYRQSIQPDAVADPQKGGRRLETTHGPGGLTEVGSGEERRRYPPET